MWKKPSLSMSWLKTQTSVSSVLGSAANSSWQRAEINPAPVLIPDRNYLLAKLLLLSSAIPNSNVSMQKIQTCGQPERIK